MPSATLRVTQRVKSDLPSASQKCSSDNDDGESRSVTRLEAAPATTPVAVKQESMEPLVAAANGGGNSSNSTTSSTSLHATNNSSSLVVSGGFVDSTTFTSRQQLMPQQPPPAPPPQQQAEQEESVVPSKDHTHSLVFLFLPPLYYYIYTVRLLYAIFLLSEGEWIWHWRRIDSNCVSAWRNRILFAFIAFHTLAYYTKPKIT